MSSLRGNKRNIRKALAKLSIKYLSKAIRRGVAVAMAGSPDKTFWGLDVGRLGAREDEHLAIIGVVGKDLNQQCRSIMCEAAQQ